MSCVARVPPIFLGGLNQKKVKNTDLRMFGLLQSCRFLEVLVIQRFPKMP
jgi:hypothetical protein